MDVLGLDTNFRPASMKVPPKRKGKLALAANGQVRAGLNESPSEKEGKIAPHDGACTPYAPQ